MIISLTNPETYSDLIFLQNDNSQLTIINNLWLWGCVLY